MSDGKDGAIDVTVTSPLASSNVAGAEAQAGASLAKACQRKVRDTADACRREGLVANPNVQIKKSYRNSAALAKLQTGGAL